MCPPSTFTQSDSKVQDRIPPEDFLPQTQISKAAYSLATSLLPQAILNHSIRVYLYAKTPATNTNSTYITDAAKHDLLFTACILHDIGTTTKYDGPQRFEVEGADAAATLLTSHGVSDSAAHEAWMAIALHTSPGIAERINELSRLVRAAVLMDFGRKADAVENQEGLKERVEDWCPRLGIEKVLGDAVVEQAVRNPGKAPAASWPNNLLKAHLAEPGWVGVNKGFS